MILFSFPSQELFVLVTDQGYLKEPNVVWETLSSVDGAGHYVDHKFVTFTPPSSQLLANIDSSVVSTIVCDQAQIANDQSSGSIGSNLQAAAINSSHPSSPSTSNTPASQENILYKQQIDQE